MDQLKEYREALDRGDEDRATEIITDLGLIRAMKLLFTDLWETIYEFHMEEHKRMMAGRVCIFDELFKTSSQASRGKEATASKKKELATGVHNRDDDSMSRTNQPDFCGQAKSSNNGLSRPMERLGTTAGNLEQSINIFRSQPKSLAKHSIPELLSKQLDDADDESEQGSSEMTPLLLCRDDCLEVPVESLGLRRRPKQLNVNHVAL